MPTSALSHCQHTFGQPKTLWLVLWSTSLVSVNLSLCPCEIMPKSCSGQGQMSFVAEQMRPCFVPFLSWPPGWGCSGTLSPKLPWLTSAVAAQGTPLPQMQSSCVSRKGTAAAQLPGSTRCCRGCTCARRGVCVCARLPVCVS